MYLQRLQVLTRKTFGEMRIDGIEFYIYENDLWYIKDGISEKLNEGNSLVSVILDKIQRFYPNAYNALSGEYIKSSINVPYYHYLMVRRFCKCNFGLLDASKQDIDFNGDFSFEKVSCPLRGECKHEGVICCPKFCTDISPAENRVMELLYRGHSVDDISERLYLSPITVKNHYKSVYKKLGVHNQAEFMRYAQKNKMYGD